jgi:hypothetical protein
MILRSLLFALVVVGLTACGTLQVGIESASPRAPVASVTATHTSAPPPTRSVLAATATEAAAPRATPAAGPSRTRPAERINFPVGGTNFTFTTRLDEGVPQRYVLQVLAQQKMTITTSRNVTVEVLDAQDNSLKPSSAAPGQWQGTIPQTGDYILVLRVEGFITVSIDIPPPG